MNTIMQPTTTRLVASTKAKAKEILASKGLNLSQYLNLAIDRLVTEGDLPFVEITPKKIVTRDYLKNLALKHKKSGAKTKSKSNEELDEMIWQEFQQK